MIPARHRHLGRSPRGTLAQRLLRGGRYPFDSCRILSLLGPLAVLGLTWTGSPLSAAAQSDSRPHVLLLSVDTLRADALHAYGFRHDVTPSIDGLATGGVLFEDALTTIGKTGPAFSSLFTSMSPPSHGARRNGIALRPDVPTLAETLSAAGYSTAAFISNWTLRTGLAEVHRGFDVYDEEFDSKRNLFGARERSADAVIDAVTQHLRNRPARQPTFLWVHFSEPHTPYEEHDEVDVPFPPESERDNNWQKRWRYAEEVAYTDTRIERLFRELSGLLDLEQTIIVFVADHGESLGEHSYWGHGKNTNWPNLKIPLIFQGPGIPKGRRSTSPAMITDIFPTLLDLLRLAAPEGATFEGRSLTTAWKAPSTEEAPLRFTVGDRHTAWGSRTRQNYEHPKEISLQSQALKVVFDFGSRTTVYYDLIADPLENNPLSEPPSETKPPWRRRLANWYRDLPKYESKTGEISEEDRKQLESLGYVGAP